MRRKEERGRGCARNAAPCRPQRRSAGWGPPPAASVCASGWRGGRPRPRGWGHRPGRRGGRSGARRVPTAAWACECVSPADFKVTKGRGRGWGGSGRIGEDGGAGPGGPRRRGSDFRASGITLGITEGASQCSGARLSDAILCAAEPGLGGNGAGDGQTAHIASLPWAAFQPAHPLPPPRGQ